MLLYIAQRDLAAPASDYGPWHHPRPLQSLPGPDLDHMHAGARSSRLQEQATGGTWVLLMEQGEGVVRLGVGFTGVLVCIWEYFLQIYWSILRRLRGWLVRFFMS